MRKLSNLSYNTTTTQWERWAGGKAWNNPEFSTPTHSNVGTTISNVLASGSAWTIWPFGPGYTYGSTGVITEPNWAGLTTPDLRFPNSLRFSGFNIAGAGITSDCVVTNLHIYLQYKDETVFGDRWAGTQYGPAGPTWLVRPYKSGAVPTIKKLFSSELQPGVTPVQVTRWARLPCMKDQNHVTDTYGEGIATAHRSFGQRTYKRVGDGWYSTPGFYGYDIDHDYNEATSDIASLTVGEINDANFYIDLWYGFAGLSGQSGMITVYSMAIEVEYIQASNFSNVIVYPRTDGINAVRGLSFTNSRQWQAGANAGGIPNGVNGEAHPSVLQGSADAYINFYSNPYGTYENRGNISDNIIKFDSDSLTAKFAAIDDIDNSQPSINDIILDIRYAAGVYNTTAYLNSGAGKVRWTYILADGVAAEHAATYSQPIWRNAIQLTEPGIRTLWNGPGNEWQRMGDGYLLSIDEVMPRDETPGQHGDKWITKHWPVRINMGGAGTQPSIQNWGVTMANTTNFPGSVYDPLWIETALQDGRFFYSVTVTLDPGTAEYNNMNPFPTLWFRIDNLSMRINYNTVAGPPTTSDAGLLYRFTP